VLYTLLRDKLNDKFNRGAENQAFLVETITNIQTVKALALEPQMTNKWERQLAGYVHSGFETSKVNMYGSQAIALIGQIVTVLILWMGASLVIANQLTIGQLIAFNMLSSQVAAPVMRLAQLWQDFQQTGISIARLADILDNKTENENVKSNLTLPSIQGRVIFDKISFRYNPDAPLTLKNINLDIASGQIIGIVGRSGSGKSTLSKLIQRLYLPEQGRILIDDVNISVVDPAWLRSQVGVVLQDNALFNMSIKDNIAVSNKNISLDRIIDIAKLAGAHDFIAELPEGYNTILGENGGGLSGGQKQRIAIARALVNNPRILIFDEATSALDYESERIIHDNMRQICNGRTVFIIAHGLSAVRFANQIIAMDNGQIVEQGTHSELLSLDNGYYKYLYSLQNA